MSKLSFSSHFRNPLFVLMFYLVMVLPYFTVFCAVDLSGTLLWSNLEVCANTFLVDSFLENSIWAILFIIVIFESLYQSTKVLGIDKTTFSFKTQMKVFTILLGAFVFWELLSLVFEWLATSIGKTFPTEHPVSSFFKVQVYGFLAFHLNGYLNRRYLVRHPLQRTITVNDGLRLLTIAIGEIQYAEKIGKQYYVFTAEGKFKIDKNLHELEVFLPEHSFRRINRSAIVNMVEITGFSFWENEKYVLTLKNGKQFVMTRKRLNTLKDDLKQVPKIPSFWQKIPFFKVFP